MTFEDSAKTVASREEFLRLVRALKEDLKQHPESWENRDLDTYLEALGAWVADMDGFYRSRGESLDDLPLWRVLADMLMAARIYE